MPFFSRISTFLSSFSQILFMSGYIPGLILLLLGILNPFVTLCGLISFGSAYGFACLAGGRNTFLSSHFFTYNSLLIGFSVGACAKQSILTALILVTAGMLTFLLTQALSLIMSYYFGLPIFSLPFILVSWGSYLLLEHYNSLQITMLPASIMINPYVDAYFKSLGNIIFLPSAIAGLCLALLLLWHSRILFSLSVLGFISGSFFNGIYLGSFQLGFSQITQLNYILVAMAIGGVFVIPSIQSYTLAIFSVLICVFVSNSMSGILIYFGLPVLVLPFVLVTMLFIYVLGVLQYKLRPILYLSKPEETLNYFLTTTQRFSKEIIIGLPFIEPWHVWQGFNGEWTHQGEWRYAYDFVMKDDLGQTFYDNGSRLDHYYCFKKPVLSPISGQVTRIISDITDNPIGSVDTTNNWGNLILIRHWTGFVVEISHFLQNSIAVKEGDWIDQGTFLGLCGNSGYSPQPHIHIQVQWAADKVSQTVPFNFSNYISNSQFIHFGQPPEKEIVHSFKPTLFYEQLTNFVLGNKETFEIIKNHEKIKTIQITIDMAVDGTFYMGTSLGKLYFGKKEGLFLIYRIEGRDPYLELIYMGLSMLPLYYKPELRWSDIVPYSIFLKGSRKKIIDFISIISPKKFQARVNYYFSSPTVIIGETSHPLFKQKINTIVTIDPYVQIQSVKCGTLEIRKVKHEAN